MTDETVATQSPRGLFGSLFARWSGRIRGRIAFRNALTGCAWGLTAAVATSAAGWWIHHAISLVSVASLGAAGIAVSWIVTHRNRWTDSDVALFLDHRLGTHEAIVTALQRGNARNASLQSVVVAAASDALSSLDPHRIRIRIFRPIQLLVPFSIVALVVLARVPFPLRPVPQTASAASAMPRDNLPGLEKVEELVKAPALNDEQRKRFDQLAADAQQLRRDLRGGATREELERQLTQLRNALTEEQSRSEGASAAGVAAEGGTTAGVRSPDAATTPSNADSKLATESANAGKRALEAAQAGVNAAERSLRESTHQDRSPASGSGLQDGGAAGEQTAQGALSQELKNATDGGEISASMSGASGSGGKSSPVATETVDAKTMALRSNGKLNPLGKGAQTETSFAQGTGVGAHANPLMGQPLPSAIGPVQAADRRDLPEEYRDQVRQYFRP